MGVKREDYASKLRGGGAYVSLSKTLLPIASCLPGGLVELAGIEPATS